MADAVGKAQLSAKLGCSEGNGLVVGKAGVNFFYLFFLFFCI
jgi:hypothetical protein